MKITFFIALVTIIFCSSCTTVKPYQRAYLNDELMKPGTLDIEGLDQTVYQYREGALISGDRKGKGGCGCN